jgi:hypothetical protein
MTASRAIDTADALRTASIQSALQEQEGQQELVSELTKSDPRVRRAMVEKLLGTEGAPQPIAVPAEAGSGGPEGVDQKVARLANDFMMNYSAPPGQAFETATRLVEADRAALKGAASKSEKMRAAANELDQVADVAQAGVEGAGSTGGFGWGAKDLASSFWALFSSDEAQQREAQTLLESVAPNVISASREAGTGAMSDQEMREYLKAGPTSSKTPGQNLEIIEKMRNVASVSRDYADFLDWYRDKFATLNGAEAQWQRYKAQNPILARGSDGKLDWNANRKAWYEVINGGQGAQVSLPTGAPTTPTAPTIKASDLLAQGYVRTPQGWVKQ